MTDAQRKYNSRAAMLYREKLGQASAQAMRRYGTKVGLLNGYSRYLVSIVRSDLTLNYIIIIGVTSYVKK